MTTNAIQCEILMTNLLTHFIMLLKQIIARRLHGALIVRTMAQIGIELKLRSLPHNVQHDSVTNISSHDSSKVNLDKSILENKQKNPSSKYYRPHS